MNRLRRKDSGLTLVELMVSTMITALIAILTTTLVIGVQRTNQENVSRQDQIDAARVSVEAMSRTLRAAVKPSQVVIGTCAGGCPDIEAFQQGGAFRVQFYANVDNSKGTVGPRRVTYEVPATGADAGKLIETIQVPNNARPADGVYQYCTPGSSGCAARIERRPLASAVVASGPAMLRYFDAAGHEMVPPAGGTLTSAQLQDVLSVEVRVTVQTTTGGARPKPTTYIQRVMMPNAQAIIKGDS